MEENNLEVGRAKCDWGANCRSCELHAFVTLLQCTRTSSGNVQAGKFTSYVLLGAVKEATSLQLCLPLTHLTAFARAGHHVEQNHLAVNRPHQTVMGDTIMRGSRYT